MIKITNNSAAASVLTALLSPKDDALVAALIFSEHRETLMAIKAELEKASGQPFVMLAGDHLTETVMCQGARKRHDQLQINLERINVRGLAWPMEHWRCGDPRRLVKRGEEAEHFYVTARFGDDLNAKFIERLQLAIPWAIKPEWADTLISLGQEDELVSPLRVVHSNELDDVLAPILGERWMRGRLTDETALGYTYRAGLRVVKDDDGWGRLLTIAREDKLIEL